MGGFVNFTTRIAPESIVAGSVVDYSLATAYTTGQIVNYNGALWTATANSTGQAPAAGSAYWEITNASQQAPKGGAILNGTSQYYSHPDNANVRVDGDFSAEWYGYINAYPVTGTGNGLIYKGINDQSFGLALYGSSINAIVRGASITNGVVYATTSTGLKHIIMTKTSTLISLYIDGVLIQTSAISSEDFTNTTEVLNLGYGTYTGAVGWLNGTSYFAKLHNYTLTQQDVTDRWNNGQPQDFVEPYATSNASQTDLITNGDFSAWSGVALNDTPDGFTVSGQDGINNYVTDATNACRLVSDGTNVAIAPTGVFCVIGKEYQYTINITNITSGTIKLQSVVSTPIQFTTTGVKTGTFIATGNYAPNIGRYGGVTDVTFTDFSVIPKGETFSIKPNDWGTNGAKCIIGGEISVANSTASPIALSDGFDGHLITSATYTMATSIYRGQLLKYVKIKNIDTGAIVLSLGTTASGTDLINAVTIPASSEVVFPLFSHFSDSVETTLYFSNTGTSNYQVRFTKDNV